ncbi:MAG: 6-carboxytetrahydropterin synthase QueD [Bacteroidetes bacterium RIFOXYB2_FULL_35_7]|nr:MAG: 6-carboxytetrahydropterin synthase QueD [Bacteroidetes bacterium GWF2_35_48]OFY94305.1 MAG: 6-carboxytetrahydropterin synthase QueD [Bacteroidetes bacterium RIFOXYB2_FULL_35_7]OFY94391.1 MAG: 6-carboxytetrahydropterin synthase QueD [Bacteroidetes bacterium RIFOXYC12_FULL_35_7]HBX50172.1 6-carboxytetrahydropterin synthase QueD [Bacteroidales bacterium]
MSVIRVTKIFKFEMAHALWNYDGLCKNIHGHSYILEVTVKGEPIIDKSNPKLGMVLDFGDLKKIIETHIISITDHAVFLSKDAPHEKLASIREMFDRCEIVDFQPTCENLVVYFAEKIIKFLPKNLTLNSLCLHETPTSYAEWYACDN